MSTFLVKCPFNYAGNKYKLLPDILARLPQDIATFYDVFGGGMTVTANITNAKAIKAFDLSNELIELNVWLQTATWLDVQTHMAAVIHEYGFSDSVKHGLAIYTKDNLKRSKDGKQNSGLDEYNRPAYLALRKAYNATPVGERHPLMLYALIVHSFNYQVRFNSRGEFNMPNGRGDWNGSMQDKLELYQARLKSGNIIFRQSDFRAIDYSALGVDDLCYFDPPYLISTAAYNEQGGWTTQDELSLLSRLEDMTKQGRKFMLSNVLRHNNQTNALLSEFIGDMGDKLTVTTLNHHKYGSYGSRRSIQVCDNNTLEIMVTNY